MSCGVAVGLDRMWFRRWAGLGSRFLFASTW